jgi:hypothetical protein
LLDRTFVTPQAVAVLTASYPLGHLPYGWLNSLKPVSPAFQQKSSHSNRPHIAGKKIAVFCASCLGVSAAVSFVVGWIPGVSVGILVNVVDIPHHLALLCVTPLRIFAFFCFTVSIRASLTGWLIFNHQTKLVAPSGFIRLAATISSLLILPSLGLTGADNGIASLFSGFFTEMLAVVVGATSFATYKRCRWRRGEQDISLHSSSSQDQEMQPVEPERFEEEENVTTITVRTRTTETCEATESRL